MCGSRLFQDLCGLLAVLLPPERSWSSALLCAIGIPAGHGLRFFPYQNVNLFHLSAECTCAFCSHTKPVVAMTTLALGIAPEQYCMAMSYLVLAALWSSRLTALTKSFACSLSKASDPRSLVMARPAGFSLWTTPILRLVVKANQTKRNVRDLVFPAQTPATASVDLPVCRAAAKENATDG